MQRKNFMNNIIKSLSQESNVDLSLLSCLKRILEDVSLISLCDQKFENNKEGGVGRC